MTATARLGKTRGEIEIEGVVTSADMARYLDQLAARLQEKDEQIVDGVAFTLPASGTQDTQLHIVPAGKEMDLHRLVVEASGFTPGAPFNGAAGAYVAIYRDNPQAPGTLIAMSLSLNGLLPIIFSFGSDCPVIRSSQAVWLRINAGPATSPSISVSLQGIYRPTVTP